MVAAINSKRLGWASLKPLGFTMIEMMITIAILGILTALAAPSFSDYVLGRRVANVAFDLNASLAYSRGEAIKRNSPVVVTPANSDNWGHGWSITAGATTLRAQGQYKGILITGSAASVTYNGAGRAGAVTLEVDDDVSNANVAPRCIKLSLAGLPYSQEGACS